MANNFPYFFQNSGASYSKASSTPFQLGIFDIDDIRLTSSQIDTLHDQGKHIFSYVSIGEAEPYRDYWNTSAWSSDLIVSKNPDWDSYTVKFWDQRWQNIIIDKVEKIAKAGYDGMYMDVVDVYEVSSVKNAYNGSSSTQAEMIKFVKTLADHVRAINPDFKVIANNAQNLLTDASYLKTIDGVGNESTYYDWNNNRVTWTEGNLALLQNAIDAGKLVLDIDYPTSESAQQNFIKMALEDGLIPFIGDRNLTGAVDSTNFQINDSLSSSWVKKLGPVSNPVPDPDPNPTPDPDPTGSVINGTSASDHLSGTANSDNIKGNDGHDTINGGSGHDTLSGGNGNDQLFGDSGNDRITGNAGSDYIKGGRGTDIINSGSGNDTIFGNEDNDKINGESGNDRLKGDAGNDTFIFNLNSGKDVIVDFTNPGSAAGDKIAIDSDIYGTVQQALSHVTYSGGSAFLDLGGGNSVQLLGVANHSMTVDDFTII